MGYQEAFRPIEHLAESAGIKKAIEEYDRNPHLPEYCQYCCTTREKATGRLYACIIGQRVRVTIIAGIYIDDRVPYGEEYSDYYDDLDESLVEKAAKERPDLVEKAYQEACECFEKAVEEGKAWERTLREEATQLWPAIVDQLQSFGPLPVMFFERCPIFKGHFMHNVMVDLEWQGLLERGEKWSDDFWFTNDAMESLGIKGKPDPLDLSEKLLLSLEQFGALKTSELAGMFGQSDTKVRSALRALIDGGQVEVRGRGRARRYALAGKCAA